MVINFKNQKGWDHSHPTCGPDFPNH
jgi:hypothetical protein